MKNPIPYFSSADVEASVSMKDAIQLMKPAFRQLSSKEAVVPVRINMNMEAVHAQSLIMPVYLPESGYYAVKIVSLNYDNPKKDLPFIHASLNLFDAETGQLVAMMDAEALTAIRTGAASGLATDYLAKDDSSKLALFGAGIQGRKQIEGVRAIRKIKQIYIYDLDQKKAIDYARKVENETGIQTSACKDQSLLKDVDIICTASTSKKAVFEDHFLKSSVHINGIGAYHPGLVEIPYQTIQNANVIVDQRESCLKEAGDLLLAMKESGFSEKDVVAELGEIVNGTVKVDKLKTSKTIFKSVGNAVQDLALAVVVFQNNK